MSHIVTNQEAKRFEVHGILPSHPLFTYDIGFDEVDTSEKLARYLPILRNKSWFHPRLEDDLISQINLTLK